MHKQFREKKEMLKNKKMQELLSKYGGEKHLEVPEELRETIRAENEDRQEMSKMAAISASTKTTVTAANTNKNFDNKGMLGVKSRYDEDNFLNGHMSVWGSYWHKVLGWGYRCCLSFDRNGACKGEESKKLTIKLEYDIEQKIKEV